MVLKPKKLLCRFSIKLINAVHMYNLYNIFSQRNKIHVKTIEGFLHTNTAPHQHPQLANYGLMDQIAGLKWIQQNIQHFGGDPESVTMFGYRNGASCIHFLMQSPAAVAGLFLT